MYLRWSSLLWPVLAGLAIRLPWLKLRMFPDTDGSIHVALAREIAAGSFGLSDFYVDPQKYVLGSRPPLYPWLMSVVSHVTPDMFAAGVLVAIIAGLVGIVWTAKLAATWFDERVGVVTAWVVAIYPIHVKYSGLILRESLAAALFTAAVLAMTHAVITQRKRTMLIAGIIMGVAFANRTDAVVFGLPVLALYAIGESLLRGQRMGPWLARLPYLVLGMLMIMVPLGTIINATTGTSFMPGQTESVLAYVQAKAALRGGFTGHWLRNINLYITRVHHLIPLLFAACMVLGCVLRRDTWTRLLLIALCFAVSMAFYAATVVEPRYLLPYAMLFLPMVGSGVVAISRRLNTRAGVAQALMVVLLAACFLGPLTDPFRTRLAPRQVALGHYKAGEYLGGQADSDTVVMSRNPLSSVVGRARWLLMPHGDKQTVLAGLEDRQVDYLIVSRDEVRRDHQDLIGLLEQTDVPSNLEPIWSWSHEGQAEAVVFKVK